MNLPDHVLITGDLNVRLDCAKDPSACQLNNLLASFDMVCHVTLPMHDIGGLLDVVIMRAESSKSASRHHRGRNIRPSTTSGDGPRCQRTRPLPVVHGAVLTVMSYTKSCSFPDYVGLTHGWHYQSTTSCNSTTPS